VGSALDAPEHLRQIDHHPVRIGKREDPQFHWIGQLDDKARAVVVFADPRAEHHGLHLGRGWRGDVDVDAGGRLRRVAGARLRRNLGNGRNRDSEKEQRYTRGQDEFHRLKAHFTAADAENCGESVYVSLASLPATMNS
jgi:hypothetical protein